MIVVRAGTDASNQRRAEKETEARRLLNARSRRFRYL